VLLPQPLQTTLLPTLTYTTEELRLLTLCESFSHILKTSLQGGSFFI
jgi:hypothetical protein